jgi:hypothetical protein
LIFVEEPRRFPRLTCLLINGQAVTAEKGATFDAETR